MRTDRLGCDAWELESDEAIELRQKLTAKGQALSSYADGEIFYGIKTGLTEVFAIDEALRRTLVAKDGRSAELIRPFVQGTHMRPWHIEPSGLFLLAVKSSNDFEWPWSDAGEAAERVFRQTYPAVFEHFQQNQERLKKRTDLGRYWWELRTCAYWESFGEPKIVWSDITNRPRCSLDTNALAFGDTAFMVPRRDYYLLAVLNSWAAWFFISKTAQPLRLRSDRWQYRLKAQYMEHVPIPAASEQDRQTIGALAERSSLLAGERYDRACPCFCVSPLGHVICFVRPAFAPRRQWQSG